MDLAKRLLRTANQNGGMATFVKVAEPNDGYISIFNERSYKVSQHTNTELLELTRKFLTQNLLAHDGVVVYKRAGRVILGTFVYHPTLTEAETFAESQNIAWLVNLADKSKVQVADFEPDITGDGVVDNGV